MEELYWLGKRDIMPTLSAVLPWMVCDPEFTPANMTCVASGGFGNDSAVLGEDRVKLKVIGAAEQYFK